MKTLELVNSNPAIINSPTELKKALLSETLFRNNDAVKSVMNIFSDCHGNDSNASRCLNALVKLNARDLIEASKKAIPRGYNGFKADLIPKILFELIKDREGLVDNESLKSIDRDYTFYFGREGSPVLYVKSKHRFWMEDLIPVFKASKADEQSVESDGSLRFWYD